MQAPARQAIEVVVVEPVAWVVDDTGFPKDGNGSPCVARQYSGTVGKVANCQIGVRVHAVTDTASSPVDRRLSVPASWDDENEATPSRMPGMMHRCTSSRKPERHRHGEP
ncbi:transposase [Nonomuraea spiralis]|uniref:Transposase n=1 Tax=Nonomuraea spiralis TaxID=46182 RepID=A0ABV5J1J4_9ACTN|nr:hypothetical protein GCM10010176_104750 [Nonomuraea spiralis]